MKRFDVSCEAQKVVAFIRNYYATNKLGGAIIGISGGKDSAVVAAIMTEALGAENVTGVWMPCHSKAEDKEDAMLISKHFGFELIEYDLTSTYETFKSNLSTLGDFTKDQTKNSDINIKPRLRMSTLYYLAALQSELKQKTYLVIGTSNKCELFVGYFTKGGDSVHDISPIADFTVDEVIQLGEYFNVPPKVLYKTPDDGLSSQTDEDKLGVTYKDITNYLNGEEISSEAAKQRIEKLHKASLHKFHIPVYMKNNNK